MPVPGLDPGIVAGAHVFGKRYQVKDVDGRVKPGHDAGRRVAEKNSLRQNSVILYVILLLYDTNSIYTVIASEAKQSSLKDCG
jgi:hypothetical protein